MQMLSDKAEPQALQGLHAPRSTSLGLCSGEDVRCLQHRPDPLPSSLPQERLDVSETGSRDPL